MNCINESQKMMKALSLPFETHELSWRVQTAIKKNDGYRILVVPYITSRTVLNRLDKVCGGFWQSHFDKISVNNQEAFQCRISLKIGGEWITRTDASEVSDIESVKGGHSNALKRAGVQWGIARYISELKNLWVDVKQQGQHQCRGKFKISGQEHYIKGYYDTPHLPNWALPASTKADTSQRNQQHVPVETSLKPQQQNISPIQQDDKEQAKLLALVNTLLEYLNVPEKYIPGLLKKSSGSTVALQDTSKSDLGKLYSVLLPVYTFVRECVKYQLDDRGMIYYAQIVLQTELENIYALFLKMNNELCDAAIKLMKDDQAKINNNIV